MRGSTDIRLLRSCFQYRQPETVATELIAIIEQVNLAIALEQMRVAQHIGIPVIRCDVEQRIIIVPRPIYQIVRVSMSNTIAAIFVVPEVGRLAKAKEHVDRK